MNKLSAKSIFSNPWLQAGILVLASALTYLPRVGELTYFKDDWYYIYDAYVAGASIFREMFSIDRPARGIFFEIYYGFFGPNALSYHLSAFTWRMIAVLGAWWLFEMLWPRERRAAFLMAILFSLYPGYLWWVSAIEYQPMIASLAFQTWSIAMTVKAIQVDRGGARYLWMAGAVLTGWLNLWLVEYAIGMEIFRYLCVFVITRRSNSHSSNFKTILESLRTWLVYAIIPFGFLVWRVVLFSGERKATDISLQLGVFLADPLSTALKWLVQEFQSVLNVGISAWVIPFSQLFFGLRLRDVFTALVLALAVITIVMLAARSLDSESGDEQAISFKPPQSEFPSEAVWLGLSGIIFGVLPIVLANRSVTFNLSHYALPASLAGVIFITGLIHNLVSNRLRSCILTLLISLAVITHHAVLVNTIAEEKAIQGFWWQLSWRAPNLKPETTLVIHYPTANIGDDGFGVMEAPNLIYFPDSPPGEDGLVHYNLSAISASDQNVKDILVGNLYRETGYRSHTVNFDFKNILVLSQPSNTACVHVLDGERPVLSASDPGNIILISSRSIITNVDTKTQAAPPQEFAFGSEPEHGWCHYFEKADLAVQMQNWDLAAALGDEAMEKKLTPEDQSEWLPFVEAYAVMGDEKKVKSLSTRLGIDDFVRIQACLNLMNNESLRKSMTADMKALIEERYCRNVQYDG